MKITSRFKRLNVWNKLGAIGAVCSILAFLGWLLWPKGSDDRSVRVNVKDSPQANVQTVVNSPGATQVAGDLITRVETGITLPLKFETSITFLRTTNKKLFDVLYLLPNNKKAFLPVVERGETYILFYTNEDVSEVQVPEKYRDGSATTNDACWIVKLVKTEKGFGNYMERGPKSYRVPPEKCYE